MKPVSRVTNVLLTFTMSDPPAMVLVAGGTVPTLGWSNGVLVPRQYTEAPSDGIWDFDFIAQPPQSSYVGQKISNIQSAPIVLFSPSWLQGVRIHSLNGSMEKLLIESSGSKQSFTTQGGIVDIFPWQVSTEGGPDYFPWKQKTEGGPDAFPWSFCKTTFFDKQDNKLLQNQINELLGLHPRIYEAGTPITEEFMRNRVNFVVSKDGAIVDISIG